MGMCGYVWVCFGMYGYVWVCMGMYGYVWVCTLQNITLVYLNNTVLYCTVM